MCSIHINKPIIEEHIQNENFTNSLEIHFTSSFESSKELEYHLLIYALYLIDTYR